MFYIKENGIVTFSRAISYRNTVVSEERDYFAATTCILKWPSLQPTPGCDDARRVAVGRGVDRTTAAKN